MKCLGAHPMYASLTVPLITGDTHSDGRGNWFAMVNWTGGIWGLKKMYAADTANAATPVGPSAAAAAAAVVAADTPRQQIHSAPTNPGDSL